MTPLPARIKYLHHEDGNCFLFPPFAFPRSSGKALKILYCHNLLSFYWFYVRNIFAH